MSKNKLTEEKVHLITQKIKKRFPETFKDIDERNKEKKKLKK